MRSRERGFHHHNTDCLVVIFVFGILAAIAIPNFLKLRASRGRTCLNHLTSFAGDSPAPDAACPYSGQAYAVEKSEDGESVGCPTPAGHLDSLPRFARAKDGSWRLTQTLPAYAGAPLELGQGGWEIREGPGRLSILVKPGGFTRYVFAPAGALLLLFLTGYCAFRIWQTARKRAWREAGVFAFGFALWASLAGACAVASGGSREFVFERGRATQIGYLFGGRYREKAYTDCSGVVPLPASTSSRRLLQLVHAPAGDGSRSTPLDTVPADRLDIADRIRRTLAGD